MIDNETRALISVIARSLAAIALRDLSADPAIQAISSDKAGALRGAMLREQVEGIMAAMQEVVRCREEARN